MVEKKHSEERKRRYPVDPEFRGAIIGGPALPEATEARRKIREAVAERRKKETLENGGDMPSESE